METAPNGKRKTNGKETSKKEKEMGGVHVDRKKRSKYEAPGTSGRRRDGCPAVLIVLPKWKERTRRRNQDESNKGGEDAEACFRNITAFLLGA